MQTLKSIYQSHFKSLSFLILALGFSCASLLARIKLNKSIFYLFLVWNIFLALVPYFLTVYLSSKEQLSRFKFLVIGAIWLLFLPNAPYIITDFVHLKVSNSYLWWIDILVLLSFSLTGLYLFYASLHQMEILINKYFKRIPIKAFRITIFFLCGFGVYLGRFLRFNSWEILSQPQDIIFEILNIIFHPFQHTEAWWFTFGFGVFLFVGHFGIYKSNN